MFRKEDLSDGSDCSRKATAVPKYEYRGASFGPLSCEQLRTYSRSSCMLSIHSLLTALRPWGMQNVFLMRWSIDLCTSSFRALLLCSSKQKSERPIEFRLLQTTFKAACFSETKRTVFPAAMVVAIMFVIVWDFPVPGGPSITVCFPSRTLRIAVCWLESASVTRGILCANSCSSWTSTSPYRGMSSPRSVPSKIAWISSLFSKEFSSGHAAGSRSSYIRSLVNEKKARWAVRTMLHLSIPWISFSTLLRYDVTLSPSSMNGNLRSNCDSRTSLREVLGSNSPPSWEISKVFFAPCSSVFTLREIGISSNGEFLSFSELSLSNQCR